MYGAGANARRLAAPQAPAGKIKPPNGAMLRQHRCTVGAGKPRVRQESCAVWSDIGDVLSADSEIL